MFTTGYSLQICSHIHYFLRGNIYMDSLVFVETISKTNKLEQPVPVKLKQLATLDKVIQLFNKVQSHRPLPVTYFTEIKI